MECPLNTAPSYELLCSGLLLVLKNSAIGQELVPAVDASAPGTIADPRGVPVELALMQLRARVASVSKELRRLIDDKDAWPPPQRARSLRDWARANALLDIAEELRDGEWPDPQGELSKELEARGKEDAPPGSTTRSDEHATLAAEWKALSGCVARYALAVRLEGFLASEIGQPSVLGLEETEKVLYFIRHGQEEPTKAE